MRLLIALLVVIPSAMALAQDDDRAELLASPKFVEDPVSPEFVEMTVARLEGTLRVVSSRSYAAFGFNTPEVQIHLPDADNSVYAQVEMPDPQLLGGEGYELENGGLDAEERVAEIRFVDAEGNPATFDRARGGVQLRYPLSVRTREVSPGAEDATITIDGPYVEYEEGLVPDAPFFAPFEPVRAYDAEGRQLEQAPSYFSRSDGERTFMRLSFHGAVERVEVDEVTRWVELAITYDLPPAPLLESTPGLKPEPLVTAGGQVTIEIGSSREGPEATGRATVGARVEAPVGSAPPPEPAPPSTPRPTPAPEVPAAPSGPPVPVRSRADLSPVAQEIAAGLTALRKVVPSPPAVVQLLAFPQGVVTVSVNVGGEEVEEYRYFKGEVSGPEAVNTQWLNCKTGMPADELDWSVIPSLWDDAPSRIDAPGEPVMQLIVAQVPCGTPWIRVPVEGVGDVLYTGEGRVLKVEPR